MSSPSRTNMAEKSMGLQVPQLQPLLAHADLEEAALRGMRLMLESVPTTVAAPSAEREFRQQIETAVQQFEQLAQRRVLILTHIGRIAGIRPEQISFSRLIRKASPEATLVLVAVQSRLQRLVRQIQHLTAVVSWVLGESRLVNSIVLQELVGHDNSDRYNANGQRSLDPSNVRFETRS